MRTITTNQELMFPSDPLMLWVELGKLRPRTKAPFSFSQNSPSTQAKTLPTAANPLDPVASKSSQ